MVQRRNGSIEQVGFKVERNEPVQMVQLNRDRTGEVIVGKRKSEKTMKEDNRRRERTREVIVVEKERLEVE